MGHETWDHLVSAPDGPVSFNQYVDAFLAERTTGSSALIVEGALGVGKTAAMVKLHQQLAADPLYRPFLVLLEPYKQPGLEDQENIWLNPERGFQAGDVSALLDRTVSAYGCETLAGENIKFKKDYLARELAHKDFGLVTPVLLVDALYQCDEAVRLQIEEFILAPFLAQERRRVIISGRGKTPPWERWELQNAAVIRLLPRQEKLDELDRFSGGYPLTRQLIEQAQERGLAMPEALNEAINILISGVLPAEIQETESGLVRTSIDRLAVVAIPFRVKEVDRYLFPGEEESLAATNKLVQLLTGNGILRYKGKGYALDEAIAHAVRQWLVQPEKRSILEDYRIQLGQVAANLTEDYPAAAEWFNKMVFDPDTLN